MFNKLIKNTIIALVVTSLLFFILSVITDFSSVLNSFLNFNWYYLPILLLLSIANYLVRFFKWDYYLKLLKINTTKKDSLKIFFSGLSMSASPGKMGEVLKSLLLKELYNEPISKTFPIIFIERLTDLLSLILLALIGVYLTNFSGFWIFIVAGFFVLVTVIISNRKIALGIINFVTQISFLIKYRVKIIQLFESSYTLIQLKPLILMLIVSVFSWFFECLAFYLIVQQFSIDIAITTTTFIYAFATIIGSISMLPGGLGATEGSLAFLLVDSGLKESFAVAATFIIRVTTLWFAIIVGFITLFFFQKGIRNKIHE